MSREHSTKKCPCSPERVRCYLQAGRFQEAQEHYTAGLALEPRSTSLLCNRARTRLREAQPVEVRAQPPWTLRTTAFSVKRAVAAACGCVLKALLANVRQWRTRPEPWSASALQFPRRSAMLTKPGPLHSPRRSICRRAGPVASRWWRTVTPGREETPAPELTPHARMPPPTAGRGAD